MWHCRQMWAISPTYNNINTCNIPGPIRCALRISRGKKGKDDMEGICAGAQNINFDCTSTNPRTSKNYNSRLALMVGLHAEA